MNTNLSISQKLLFCELEVVLIRFVHDPPVKLYQICLSLYQAALVLKLLEICEI